MISSLSTFFDFHQHRRNEREGGNVRMFFIYKHKCVVYETSVLLDFTHFVGDIL